jgi:tyrosine-protein phosphatase SIW14
MPRSVRLLLGLLLTALLIGGPWAYASYRRTQTRNFRIVHDGHLYRSGQMTLSGLKRVVHDYGIKTVITLRDAATPGERPPDSKEEAYCLAEEINYFRIPPRAWWAPDGPAPVEAGVKKFLDIVTDPDNHPVLVHCFAGSHRTGAYCAIYRMEVQHWSNEEALAEMKACGYSNLDEEWDILGYLEQYRPTWKKGEPSERNSLRHRPPAKPRG